MHFLGFPQERALLLTTTVPPHPLYTASSPALNLVKKKKKQKTQQDLSWLQPSHFHSLSTSHCFGNREKRVRTQRRSCKGWVPFFQGGRLVYIPVSINLRVNTFLLAVCLLFYFFFFFNLSHYSADSPTSHCEVTGGKSHKQRTNPNIRRKP